MTVDDEELGRLIRDVLTQEADTMDVNTQRAHPRFRQEIANARPARRRTVLVAVAAVLALIVAGGIGWAWFGDEADRTIEPADPGVVLEGPALLDIETGETTPLTLSLPTDLDAEDEELLSADLDALWFDVSGDGNTVAWRNQARIAIDALDESDPHVVSVADPDGFTVTISPDGATVAVAEGNTIAVIDVATGEKTVVHEHRGELSIDAVFLRGDAVFFSLAATAGGGNATTSEMWRVPVTGGNPVLLQPDAFPFDVAADGSALAFGRTAEPEQFISAPPDTAPEPITVNDNGTTTTADGPSYGVPLFSPDGTTLLYATITRILDLETGELREIPGASGWRIRDWITDDTVLVTPSN